MNINKNAAPRENTVHGKACWQVCVWGAVHPFLAPFAFRDCESEVIFLYDLTALSVHWNGFTAWCHGWTHIFFCVSVKKPGGREGEGRPSASASMTFGNLQCEKASPFLLKCSWLSTPNSTFTVLHGNSATQRLPLHIGQNKSPSGLLLMTHGLVRSRLSCKTMILKRPFFYGSWFCHS